MAKWKRDGRTVYATAFIDGGERNIFSAHVESYCMPHQESERIAALMRAAPQLLAALKAIREWLAALALVSEPNGLEAKIRAIDEAIQAAEPEGKP